MIFLNEVNPKKASSSPYPVYHRQGYVGAYEDADFCAIQLPDDETEYKRLLREIESIIEYSMARVEHFQKERINDENVEISVLSEEAKMNL